MNENPQNNVDNLIEPQASNPGRRKFLGHLTKAAAAAAAVGAIGIKPFLGGKSSEVLAQKKKLLPSTLARATAARDYRINMAINNFNATIIGPRPDNGDEALYSSDSYFASYSKGLPHHNTGEVDPPAYQALLTAVNSGNPADFDVIPRGTNPFLGLVSPQAGFAFDLEGKDAFSYIQPPPPAFASREEAAEIAENYWMALLRDVPFDNYATNPIAINAAADLTLFGNDFKGPKVGGEVTPNTLFRGSTPGDLNGPYMSQFWFLDANFGANGISQQIRTVRSPTDGGQDYMTDFDSWLSVQQGARQTPDIYDTGHLRYMRNGRDLGQWVHIDVLFQGYFQAFLVLAGMGAPLDAGNPYTGSANQVGFATFGGPHLATLLCEVSTRALHAVWNQKWLVHRRLRPEVFAERCDRASQGIINYPVHPDILTSLNSGTRLGRYFNTGNKLLPMAFPEGSPLHPAYGAGHATVAGACTTILKAWFDGNFVIQNPVTTDAFGQNLVPYVGPPLTVRGELNKLASNVALGRNIAGVHWRSDATESLLLGEQVAIDILRDQRASYNEDFNGFTFTKFDGTSITV